MNEQEHFEWLSKEWEEAFASEVKRRTNLKEQRKTSTNSENADEKTNERLMRFMKGEDLDD